MSKTAFPHLGNQRSDFDFLVKGISYKEVVAHVGKEDRDVGSGTYILVYNLVDGSKIYLQFFTLEHLYSASIRYADGRSEFIIEP